MNSKTKVFLDGAQTMLKKVLQDQNTDKGWLKMLQAWSNGMCFCHNILEVTAFEKTGSGARWVLKCGHVYNIISLEETVNLKEGYSVSSIGKTASGEQDIKARVGGVVESKENREISVIKLLCHNFKPKLTQFANDIQNSPVDVIAKTKHGEVENFQVTRLQDSSFWKELNKEKEVERITSEISPLIELAVTRKVNFDSNSKGEIILVIDAWPGVTEDFANEAKSLRIVKSAGFKEIWLAGSVKELTFKIYP